MRRIRLSSKLVAAEMKFQQQDFKDGPDKKFCKRFIMILQTFDKFLGVVERVAEVCRPSKKNIEGRIKKSLMTNGQKRGGSFT